MTTASLLRAALAAGLLCLALACRSTEPEVDRSRALFDGRTLDGFVFDFGDANVLPSDIFSARDGMLVATGAANGVIRTEEVFESFLLELSYRWAPGSEGGNSGILIHASQPRVLGVWPRCHEVQLMSGRAGEFYLMDEELAVADPELHRKGNRVRRFLDDVENPVGEWNDVQVLSKGGEITVWLNEKLCNKGWNASATRGAICLQSEGAEIHFRDVRVTEL